VTYRDELEAAQARAEATERENDELRRKLAEVAAQQSRPKVPIPERFVIDEDGDGITVRWRWFRPVHIAMLFFCVAWDSFLVFVYTETSGAGWIAFVFPVGHVAVGIGLTYYTLASLVNRTAVRATRDAVAIRVGPVPWIGSCTIARAEIDQLYVEDMTKTQNSSKGAPAPAYVLNMIDRNGRKRRLVSGFDQAEQARWLEIELERRLGIVSQPVAGEVGS
jgi:hypothetical protein